MPKILKAFMFLFILGSYGCAERMAHWAVGLERWRSNLEEKSVRVGNFDLAYLEGGQGPSLLLVHGFGGDKEHWTRFARKFTEHYRVIAIDLPGFGESSRIAGKSYGPIQQAERLEGFRKALNLGKIHIAGNSMGGMIATMFARQYPEQTLSLILLDSAGFRSPEPSELSKELREGRNPLLVAQREDMDRLLQFSFVTPPYIPSSVVDALYLKSKANYTWNQGIFAEISKAGPVGEEALPQIQAPLLVLWGDSDRVIHVSSTKVIERLKPSAEIHIIPSCGHAPMIEKPEESAALIQAFLKRHEPKTT